MALQQWDSIYLVTHPLRGVYEAKGSISDTSSIRSGSSHSTSSSVKGSYSSSLPLKHWAIRVRRYYYDVSALNDRNFWRSGKTAECVYGATPKDRWEADRAELGLDCVVKKIGATFYLDDAIRNLSRTIWDDRMDQKYVSHSSNCQNFAYLLQKTLCVSPEDYRWIPKQEQESWESLPARATQYKHAAFKGAIATGALLLSGAGAAAFEEAGHPNLARTTAALAGCSAAALLLSHGRDRKWLHDLPKQYRFEREIEFARYPYAGYSKDTIWDYTRLGYMTEDVVLALQRCGVPTRLGVYLVTEFQEDENRFLNVLNGYHWGAKVNFCQPHERRRYLEY